LAKTIFYHLWKKGCFDLYNCTIITQFFFQISKTRTYKQIPAHLHKQLSIIKPRFIGVHLQRILIQTVLQIAKTQTNYCL